MKKLVLAVCLLAALCAPLKAGVTMPDLVPCDPTVQKCDPPPVPVSASDILIIVIESFTVRP